VGVRWGVRGTIRVGGPSPVRLARGGGGDGRRKGPAVQASPAGDVTHVSTPMILEPVVAPALRATAWPLAAWSGTQLGGRADRADIAR